VAHNEEAAEPTRPAGPGGTSNVTHGGGPGGTGPVRGAQQSPKGDRWTIYALSGATAIALILAVIGWSRASNYSDEADGLRGQVADLKGQVSGLQGEVSNLKGQVTTISGERDALKPLQTQVASLGQEIDDFSRERSLMLNDRNGVVQRLGAITWVRDVADNRIVGLEREVASLTSERDSLKPLVDEVARLDALRANLLDERNALVQQVGGVAWARDIAEGKLAQLNKDLEAMTGQRDQIAADIATIEQSVGSKQELTGQVARLQAEAKEVEGQLANLTSQRDELKAEIAQAETRVSELQKAADLAGQNLAAVANEVNQRTQSLNAIRQQQQEATRQAEAAKAVFLDAEKQLSMLRDQMVNQAEVLRAAAKPGSGEKDASTMPAGGNADDSGGQGQVIK
jgi:chromosome segregation ATPase